MSRSSSLYRRHHFPGEIISRCVWLYCRFSLSYRDIEEMMAQRGVRVSYETIRQWCLKFGQTIADELRRRRPRPGEKWHLDEVYLKINGRTHYLWRAVDQQGIVLDILVQSRRNKQAAMRFLGRLLTSMHFAPRIIVTDKLKSYGAAIKELKLEIEHRQHKGLNNRAENSHQPTRERERRMRRFKSAEQAQRFLAPFGLIDGHFRLGRHRLKAKHYRQEMGSRFRTWREVSGLAAHPLRVTISPAKPR
jgi:putative transposase